MKKSAAKIFVGAAFLLGGILLLIAIEHLRGNWALNSRFNQLAAKGEELDISELLPPKTSRENNAALDLFALTNSVMNLRQAATSAPPVMKLVAPGRAAVSWQRQNWVFFDGSSNSWAKFEPEIEAAKPTLDKLENIWHKTGFDDGLDYSKGFDAFESPRLLIFSKSASVLLSAMVVDDLHRGNLPAAVTHLHSFLALVKVVQNEKLTISQLVRHACAMIAFNDTWEALQAPGWNDAQLAEIQGGWQANDFPPPMSKSLEMERAMTVEYYRRVRSSWAKAFHAIKDQEGMEETFGEGFTSIPTHGFVLHYLHLPIWRAAWAAQDELHALNRWNQIIDGDRMARVKSWREARDFLPKFKGDPDFLLGLFHKPDHELALYDRCRFLLSEAPFSVNGSIVLRALKIETQKNMIITAIALKRFQLRHGQPAVDTSALIPEFLSKLPLDCMDGKPIRYHLRQNGIFTLYSVGLDGKDDGGDPESGKPFEHFSNIWAGKDAVWPVPASRAEIIAAERNPPK